MLNIVTKRLILTSINIDDAEEIFKYRTDKETNKYQGWIPETLEDARNFIRSKIYPEIDVADTWFQFAVRLRETNTIIGDVGIHFLPQDDYQAEFGCTLDKNYQKKGYATEALSEIFEMLFYKLNKRRIIASIDPRNTDSIVLVERLGFRREAHFKESVLINNVWVDDLVYAILKDEWMKKQFKNKRVSI